MVTGLRHGTWIDEESFEEKDLNQGEWKKGRHSPAFLRHMGSGLYAETDAGRFMLGKHLTDKKIPW